MLSHISVHAVSLVPGNTALHKAVGNSHDSTVELLLKHGADIEAAKKNGPGDPTEMRLEQGRWTATRPCWVAILRDGSRDWHMYDT